MRPVNRGSHPLNSDGSRRKWSEYPEARGALIERIGGYCSYCEMRLPASLAVEHVIPKSLAPSKRLRWENFLLACTNCNSTKGNKPVVLRKFVWPDRENTFEFFQYGPAGIIAVASKLKAGDVKRARNTLQLTGLDKSPTNDPSASDRRWIERQTAWGKAQEAKKDLAKRATDALRRWIVNCAVEKGQWSVWMTVFHDDPDMRLRLIAAFAGTAAAYFP